MGEQPDGNDEAGIPLGGEEDLIPLEDEAAGGPEAPKAEALPEVEEPIRLVDTESGQSPEAKPALKAFGAATAHGAKKAQFKRELNLPGTGATRCRIFHSKIQISSLEYMETQINEWLDGERVEIKHVGHVIGTMEGKRPEPNMVVMVWY